MSEQQVTTELIDPTPLGEAQKWELLQRKAKAWSQSTMVPKEYQANLPNCLVALDMAARTNSGVLQVMQNLVVIHGKPTWSAQYLIATWGACGRYSPIRYRFTGEKGKDSWGCIAWAVEHGSGEILEGTEVTIGIAKAEGWYDKAGSKWKTMPEQMLRYRAAAWLVRAYDPGLSMGMQTTDEVEDVVDSHVVQAKRVGNLLKTQEPIVKEVAV
jgi:hypothetical protein